MNPLAVCISALLIEYGILCAHNIHRATIMRARVRGFKRSLLLNLITKLTLSLTNLATYYYLWIGYGRMYLAVGFILMFLAAFIYSELEDKCDEHCFHRYVYD